MSTPDRIYKVCTALDGSALDFISVDPRADGLRAADYEDVYKFSAKHAIIHRHLRVSAVGARENAIDINNRCTDLVFEDLLVEGGQQSGLLAKGGCANITVRRAIFDFCEGWCDVLLGDWSDQSFDQTTGVVLEDVFRHDGKPVRVVCGRADWPKVTGGNVKICYGLSYLLKAYWWTKYATRKAFGGKLSYLMP